MLGSNTEKLLKTLDNILTASASLNIAPVSYRIEITGNSDQAGAHPETDSGSTPNHSHGPGSYQEKNHPGVISNVSKLSSIKATFDAALQKVNLIDKNIYVKNTAMHNSIGSPYTELYRLQAALNDVISYSQACNTMGEYVQACSEANRLLNRAVQLVVDAKWAVITYCDYLERGYNHVQGQNPDTTT